MTLVALFDQHRTYFLLEELNPFFRRFNGLLLDLTTRCDARE